VPKKGRKHVLRVIRELLFHVPEHEGTSLSAGLEYLLNILSRKSVLFVVSDFLDTGYERPLQVAARRHDVILMRITDPRELELPAVGLVRLVDAETGRVETVDASSRQVRQGFKNLVAERRRSQERFFTTAGIDFIDLRVGSSYIEPLMGFFRMRAKKFR